MILNAYAVLDGFTTFLRLVVALFIIGAALCALMRRNIPDVAIETEHSGERYYLLALLSCVLMLLNVAAWPLFYLMLESYIPQWPGVMCIYGVTQIGAHSEGVSRYLPTLVRTLETTKPLLVFVSGLWFVLHLANRRTATAPLNHRIFMVLLVLGSIACVDCAVEIGYLAIPKTEETLESGCCTVRFDDSAQAEEFLPQAWRAEENRTRIVGSYWGLNGFLLVALLVSIRACRWQLIRLDLASLLVLALLSLPVSLAFLIEVAAPTILHLPYHHCPYDLLPKAPESVLAIVLYLLGMFAVGWACLAWWVGNSAETRPFLKKQVAKLLLLGFFGYLGSLVMMYLELALA